MIAWMIGADRKTNIFGRLVRHRQKAAVFFGKRLVQRARSASGGSTKTARPSLIEFGTAGQGAVFDLMYDLC